MHCLCISATQRKWNALLAGGLARKTGIISPRCDAVALCKQAAAYASRICHSACFWIVGCLHDTVCAVCACILRRPSLPREIGRTVICDVSHGLSLTHGSHSDADEASYTLVSFPLSSMTTTRTR